MNMMNGMLFVDHQSDLLQGMTFHGRLDRLRLYVTENLESGLDRL